MPATHRHDHVTYPPLDTLKPIAEDVWIVDGPAIRFGMPFAKMAFPTRMTVIRLGDALFVHSPTSLGPALQREVDALGSPRWIVAPNRIHYSWVPDWRQAYPDAAIYLAPRVREQARGRIDFPAQELSAASGYPWDGVIATLPVRGRFMTEVEFFHRPSRTLVLTDLIENFEPARLVRRRAGSRRRDAARHAIHLLAQQGRGAGRGRDDDRLAARAHRAGARPLVRQGRRRRIAPRLPLAAHLKTSCGGQGRTPSSPANSP